MTYFFYRLTLFHFKLRGLANDSLFSHFQTFSLICFCCSISIMKTFKHSLTPIFFLCFLDGLKADPRHHVVSSTGTCTFCQIFCNSSREQLCLWPWCPVLSPLPLDFPALPCHGTYSLKGHQGCKPRGYFSILTLSMSLQLQTLLSPSQQASHEHHVQVLSGVWVAEHPGPGGALRC